MSEVKTTQGDSGSLWRSPLADFHRESCGRLEAFRGVESPARFTDEAQEADALVESCGLIDRSWMERIEMTGEDRVRFLGGLVTCDVAALETGSGTYGFVTDVKGRVMADVVVLALEDRLRLIVPPGTAEEIAAHLGKYVIVDRVEISVLQGSALQGSVAWTLAGPKAARVLEVAGVAAGDLPEKVHDHRELEVAGLGVHLVREPSLGAAEAWTLWTAADQGRQLAESLLEAGAADGLQLVGFRAYDRLRIEAGRPLFGVDFDRANFPQETGLGEEGVSYTKGCYLGQEVVARIHYRGGVNRHLRGLAFAPGSSVDDVLGRELLAGGRAAGRVTSAADAGERGVIGLSILHRRAEPGTDAEVEGGGSARVVEL